MSTPFTIQDYQRHSIMWYYYCEHLVAYFNGFELISVLSHDLLPHGNVVDVVTIGKL
jgi:hypothetical protein